MTRTTRSQRGHLSIWAAALFAATLAPSCAKKAEPSGELILAIQTDMSIPKDIDAVWIEIYTYGSLVFQNRYEVGPAGVKIPATLALQADPGKSPPVSIRVISERQAVTRTLREVVTTIPPERVATLRVPIQWLCDGSGQRVPDTKPQQFINGCPAGQTCIDGACAASDVDSSQLPAFKSGDVFGGGTGDGDGSCFDTLSCFATSVPLQVDAATCSADASALGAADAQNLNVALQLPVGGDGICDSTHCLVPLDASADWAFQNNTLTLPPAVCARLKAGTVQSVVATAACATKTSATPTCGPWSSVGGAGDDGGAGTGGSGGTSGSGGAAGVDGGAGAAGSGGVGGSSGSGGVAGVDGGAGTGGSAGTASGGTAGASGASGTAGAAGACSLTLCGGACVDTQTDVTNCGSCGHQCATGGFCTNGDCGSEWAGWRMPNPVAAGLPNPASYDTTTPGVVLDNVTGLMWERVVAPNGYAWADAKTYCASLTLAGHNNWRLPTEIELVSLVDYTASPAIDATAFPGTSSYFWSSSPVAGDSINAWVVSFINGYPMFNDVTIPFNVRCVR